MATPGPGTQESTDVSSPRMALFVRHARQAAHHCLYFLYHFQRTGWPATDAKVATARRVAMRQVRALLGAVRPPRALIREARQTPSEAPRLEAHPEFPVRGWRHALFERDAAQVSAEEAARFWALHLARIASRRDVELSAHNAAVLIGRLQKFLTIAREASGRSPLDRFALRVYRVVQRNAALLLGLAATAIVYTRVPAISNLLFNMPWHSIAPPLLLVLIGGVGVGFLNFLPPIAIGKGAFWRVAYQAQQPLGKMDMVHGCGRVADLIGRAEVLKLAILLAWLLLPAAGLIGGTTALGLADRTQKTLFLVSALFLLKLVGLHWLDHWDFLDHRPVRLLGLAALGALGALALSQYWAPLQPLLAVVPLAYVAWWLRRWFSRRHPGWVRTTLAVTSAAMALGLLVGGRTRERSVWGSARHGELLAPGTRPARIAPGDWPAGGADGPPVVLMAASGGGSRAAVYAAYVLERLHRELPAVAENLQAISSVSGGSVANAAYIARRRKLATTRIPFWDARNDPGECADLHDGDLVHAVGKDFLLPTLEGAVYPNLSRGEAIERAFAVDAEVGGDRLQVLAEDWNRKPATPPFPVPLFNSCTLDAHAVVISPLDRSYYAPPAGWPRAGEETLAMARRWYDIGNEARLTWVLDRDQTLAFDDLNSHYSPTLPEAVRASANFPFGFPLVEVRTDSPYGVPYVTGSNEVKLTDGGVLSNSGMWTLFELMMRPPARERLERRGALLIIVDASFMPEYAQNRRDLLSLYGAIADQAPIAQNLHRRMLDILQREYGPRLDIVQIDLVPTQDDNVLTTWALDDVSKRKLRRSFCRVWFPPPAGSADVRGAIAKRWDHLACLRRGCPPEVAAALPPALVRPPLD